MERDRPRRPATQDTLLSAHAHPEREDPERPGGPLRPGLLEGLLGWMRRRMLADENIVPGDMGLLRTLDTPEAVVAEIRKAHGRTDGPRRRRS